MKRILAVLFVVAALAVATVVYAGYPDNLAGEQAFMDDESVVVCMQWFKLADPEPGVVRPDPDEVCWAANLTANEHYAMLTVWKPMGTRVYRYPWAGDIGSYVISGGAQPAGLKNIDALTFMGHSIIRRDTRLRLATGNLGWEYDPGAHMIVWHVYRAVEMRAILERRVEAISRGRP